ncbi:MAG: hypothetical protein Q9180_002937 [Flavoplaca navasiana]
MFAKLSILIFYHRLFGVNVPFRRAVFAVSALVVGYCLSLALATLFQCTPPAAVKGFLSATSLRSLLPSAFFSNKSDGVYPVEDNGSTEHEKHTYRVLVESGREKRLGDQGGQFADKGSEKTSPQIPLDILHQADVFRGHGRLDHDLESGSDQVKNRSGA